MARSATSDPDLHGGAIRVPRTRGAISGFLLLVLGAWGALAAFIGPYFSFAFSPDKSWTWTSARGWLEVLPGAAIAFGALLLLMTANRLTASFGAWLAVLGGAWFVIGRDVAGPLKIGSPGHPTASSSGVRAVETIAFFSGLGALVIFLAASAIGRLSVRSVRDVKAAQRREAQAEEQEAAERAEAERQVAERQEVERKEADRAATERETAERETAEREAAERETAERETAERETAGRQDADRAAAERGTAERDAADPSAADGDAAREADRPDGATAATPPS